MRIVGARWSCCARAASVSLMSMRINVEINNQPDRRVTIVVGRRIITNTRVFTIQGRVTQVKAAKRVPDPSS